MASQQTQLVSPNRLPATLGASPPSRPDESARPERFNVRFFLGLVVVVALAGAVWRGLHALQVKRNAQALRESAEQAKEEGRRDRAAKFLAAYLTQRPADLDARVEYADLLAGLANTPKARQRVMAEYARILEQDPGRHEARRHLAELAVNARDFDEAVEQLTVLQKAFPQDGEVKDMLAGCYEAKLEYQKATKQYESCVSQLPQRIETYVKLAKLLRDRLDKPGKADTWLENMLKANKGSSRPYLARAQFRQEAGQWKDAEQDVNAALALTPGDPQALLLAAQVCQAQPGGGKRARQHLEYLLERHPKEPRAYEALAALETEEHGLQKAIDWLRLGLKKVPGEINLRWNLAHLLAHTGDLVGARETLGPIPERAVPVARMKYLRAVLEAQEGKWLAASKSLEAVRPLLAGEPSLVTQADMLLGRCYEGLGDLSGALLSYRRIISREPLHPGARFGVVSVLLQQGRPDLALDECQNLMKAERHPAGGWTVLARLMILDNLRRPADRREWDQVTAVLRRAEEESPKSDEVTLLRAEMLIARKSVRAARRLLESASKASPQKVSYRIALASLAAREGRGEDALRILDEAVRPPARGDTVELRLARCQVLVACDQETAARSLARLAEGTEGFSEEERVRLWQGLAAAYLQRGKLTKARDLWQRVAALVPTDLSARVMLFDLAHQADDETGMQAALKAIRQIEGPGGPLGNYNQARLFIRAARNGDKGRLSEARALLTQVGQKRVAWSRVPLALAEIDELEKNGDAAVENYLRAIELGERQVEVVRRTVQLLFERKRFAQADLVLRKLPEQAPASGNLQQLAAQVALQMNDRRRALEYARKAVPPGSKNPAEQRWLGQVLWAAGSLKEAEEAFQRAVALDGADPDNRVAFVQYLARTGQMEKAKKATETAQRELGKGTELALAQCYAVINQPERARGIYQAVLRARPRDADVLRNAAEFFLREGAWDEAERCLASITTLDQSAADVRWARNLLMVVKTARGTPEGLRTALAMLDKTSFPEMGPEELRARAVVLVAQTGRKYQEEAIRTLEYLNRRQPLSPEDRFLLVQLYERVGEPPKAREELERVLAADGKNPRYLAYKLRMLLRQGLTNEAQTWLAALEEVDPEGLTTLELKARLLTARGGADRAKAVDLVKARAEQEKQLAKRLLLAELLESLGQGVAAEELYRSCVRESKNPEATLVLARFLGRQGKVDEGLRVCDEASAKCSPEAVGYASLAILREGRGTEAQCLGVKRRLEGALQKAPKTTGLLVCLADLEDLRGRYADAERLYREVLTQDPGNAEALNNLAGLLALRAGSVDEALRLANRAVEVLGPLPEALDTRALAYLAAGQTERAVAELRDAAVAPSLSAKTLALIRFHLARAYRATGKEDEARRAFKQARAAGLSVRELHPLERPEWDELEKRTTAKH